MTCIKLTMSFHQGISRSYLYFMLTRGTSRSSPSSSSHATTTSKCPRSSGSTCLATVTYMAQHNAFRSGTSSCSTLYRWTMVWF